MANRRLPALVAGAVVLAALASVAAGLIWDESLPGRLLRGRGVQPGPRHPTCGQAMVDGSAGEWSLDDDAFADVYANGQENNAVEARLYLRYDCRRELMHVLMLSSGEGISLLRRSQVQLALDSTNNPVRLVDFAWVEPGYGHDSGRARGWEACFPLPQGEHRIWVSARVLEDGEVREASTSQEGVPMALACDDKAPVFLSHLKAVPAGGQIRLEWETAWEMNNQGFNVYHSSSRQGPWTRLNRNLITSQAAEDLTGARYEFVHAGVDLQTENYYLVEELAVDGIATRHGPITP